MSRHFCVGQSFFCAIAFLASFAFGINVDSLPVWDVSKLTNKNAGVVSEDSTYALDSLSTHGYKTVQITVGDGGTQVDQELRLSINGKLTDSVYIDALLSDVGRRAGDQTTATLREVDEIYFRVTSPHYFLHLGDLTWRDTSMSIYGFERSSLGAMGGARLSFASGHAEVSGVVGTDEVKHYTRSFNGVSGQQVGYSLNEFGNFVSVVPESETVWLNGAKLLRGRDYIVNYAGGMLDFKRGVVPSIDDEIRIEYDAYDDDDVFTLYGAQASFKHKYVYLDISGFMLKNDVDKLKHSLWTDEDYIALKADNGSEFVRSDTLPKLKRPYSSERIGARMRVQQNEQFYADIELSMNKMDSNIVSNNVNGPVGRAFRWYVTSDSTKDLRHFPLAVSVYGNRINSGYDILRYPGSDTDWSLYNLRDVWDLAYSDSSFLNDDIMHDEFTLSMRLGKNWFGYALWGYRRNDSESWSSSRASVSIEHRNNDAFSKLSLIRVESYLERSIERYQGTLNAEFLRGTLRPFGAIDMRYTQINYNDNSKNFYDEIFYEKSSAGLGLFLENGEIRETIGEKVARHRGSSFLDNWSDSLIAYTWQQEATFNTRYVDVSHMLQYEHLKTDSIGENDSWTANFNSHFGAEELGFSGSASYELGLTEEQVYTSVYKAVAKGTGDVRYDSLTGAYIEGVDNGDFVYEGEGRNDSIGAKLSSNASFSADIRLNPGVAFGVSNGFLKDITLGLNYEGESSDTTGKKVYFSPVNRSQLHKTTSGRMLFGALLDWVHQSGVSATYKPSAEFSKKLSSIPYYETSYSHSVDVGYKINLDNFIGATYLFQKDELSTMQTFKWNIYDGSLRYRLDFLQYFNVEPLARYRFGKGSDDSFLESGKFDATLIEGSLRIGYDRLKKINSFAKFSVVKVKSNGSIVPYQVMSGYSDGLTYRLEFSLSADINDFISVGCKYVLRFGDAEENVFQKLSTEARAYF